MPATSSTPQVTDFTRDVMGRYICNGLDEARNSGKAQTRPRTPAEGLGNRAVSDSAPSIDSREAVHTGARPLPR